VLGTIHRPHEIAKIDFHPLVGKMSAGSTLSPWLRTFFMDSPLLLMNLN